MKNFKQLKIWVKGFEIAGKSYRFIKSFPKEERFGLTSQITNAAVSIPSNIAEGCSRTSQKDYSRFLQIALGSSFELETQVAIALNAELGNLELGNELLRDVDEEQKMIMAFMNKLNC